MTMRKWLSVSGGEGHPTWGATWLDVGRLRLIKCVPRHPNSWMVVWRRGLPEWNREEWERRRQVRLTPEARAAARAEDERLAAEARETLRAEAAVKIINLRREGPSASARQ
jgi:hypothetical protein